MFRRGRTAGTSIAALLTVALSLAAPLLAQQQSVPQQDVQTMSETVSVGYVMIPFTVLGEHGAPITDLRKGELQLLIDGQPVRSDMFEKSQNAPVSFTILLDGSGSMGLAGKMDAARAAIGALIAHRQKGDDFALYMFDDKEAHELVPFTEDVSKITAALARVKPFGKTAFFDALATMPERSRLGQNPTRAIILLSDGIDNNSRLTRAQLAERLEGIAVPIYPLGLRDAKDLEQLDPRHPQEELTDIGILDEIANLTGGKLHLGNRTDELALAVASLERSLRAQYLVGFSPTGKGAVKYRHISLKLAGRVRAVRVRAGYMGTEPPALSARGQLKNERKGS